jgi:uncharacterized membrane protein YeaQ/YmgE (transglycosylase-associated protein family)
MCGIVEFTRSIAGNLSVSRCPNCGALGKIINVYIWCALGAFAGWLLTRMSSNSSKSNTIENILLGMFGAFIGGDFVAVQISGEAVAKDFHLSSLLLAVAGAFVMLALLQLMRKAVGPMRNGVSKKKRDY